jgi:hypothetical protein
MRKPKSFDFITVWFGNCKFKQKWAEKQMMGGEMGFNGDWSPKILTSLWLSIMLLC